MRTFEEWLREPARSMAPAAVLAQPLELLQGVSPDAATVLERLGIRTILDLGASALFAVARQIVDAADGVGPLGSATPLPADMIDDSAAGLSAAEVARRPIDVLRMLGAPLASRLADLLPARSVRDLGLWPAALAARRLVSLAYGGGDDTRDEESPSELQPRMGRLPVDRVQHDILLFEAGLPELERMLASSGGETGMQPPLTVGPPAAGVEPPPLISGEFPLDLTPQLLGQGFSQPGFGFVLTIAQSWYSVGLSLGQLLHSLALAPGEATRIAVVDWSRRVAARTAEGIEEDETLRASMDRNRSINEVTSAVSREAQSGFSRFNITGEGGGVGGGAVGGNEKVQGALSFGYANNNSRGTVFGSSQGSRNVGGDMLQKAHDRTEQYASLSRSRRASIVSEVSVQEAERLSTRVVANYNHMHALSVLYFEIVQLYRVVSECLSVEPLLYLPVRPLNFADDLLLDRYRALLAQVALTPAARDALLGIVARPKKPAAQRAGSVVELGFFNPSLTPELFDQRGVLLRESTLRAVMGEVAAVGPNLVRFDSRRARLAEVQVGTIDGSQTSIASTLTIEMPSRTQAIGFARWARPPKNPQKYLPEPGDSLTAYRAILPRDWDAGSSHAVLKASGGGPWQKLLAEAGSMAQWPQMRFVFELLDPASGQATGSTTSFIAAPPAPGPDDVMQIAMLNRTLEPLSDAAAEPSQPPFDLAGHLKANALHYTMALLGTADPSLLGIYLSNLSLGGRPLMGQVDPVPVATVGNYLVFRWPALAESTMWQALCELRGVPGTGKRTTTPRESLVPIASGGVFAEAVLGRFNSAEKLDLTRFWNWQDSPIPILPPDIAPLQAGGRDGVEALRPGDLGAASLQVRDPGALPDPTGTLAKALEIAGKGDSFRDMSGMNNLLSAGGAAMTLAAQNAKDFMKTAMESLSAYGARVNHGKNMDEREAKQGEGSNEEGSPGSPAGGAPAATPGTPGTPVAPGTSAPGSPSPRKSATPGNEKGAFEGPQPDRPAPSRPAGGDLRLTVQVVNVTARDAATHTTASLTGRLVLRGVRPASGAGPGADGVVLEIQDGWGEAMVSRSGSSLLGGELRIATAGSVETLLLDRDLPGTRAGWFANALIEETRELNVVPLKATPMPVEDSGALTLRVELQMYWPADLQRFVTDPRLAATLKWGDPVSWGLIPGTIPNGRDLTDAELQQTRELIRSVVRATRNEVLNVVRAPERRSAPVPVVAFEQTQHVDPADRAFHNRVRWLAVQVGQLRLS